MSKSQIPAGGIADSAVTTAKINADAITDAKIADGVVGTEHLTDTEVTFGKLSTSGTEGDNVKQRVAKAWVNFQGSDTVAINDDFNVSSITDNGTGNYTVNLSTSLGNDNGVMSAYSVMDGLVYGDNSNVSSAGSFRMRVVIPSTNANYDSAEVHVIILGDS